MTMQRKKQIKALEANNAGALEEKLNKFLKAMEYDAVSIDFKTSFRVYEGGETRPVYIAFVTYLDAPGNVKAAANF